MVMVRPVPDCAVAMGSLLDEVNLVCPVPAAFTPGAVPGGCGPTVRRPGYAPNARDTV
ncbi:hypothetical protein GCM10010478_51800 [Streptomyces erythrogriseus]|uniref:Uncharacterized protein n=3 Tax=Streptomyces TaxID=1883 RepID=A0ABP6JRK5_9ACTN|nr:hypothetical protein GCM10010265_29040 [Streptomyces griseoincarnatus]GGT57912.1 hypothetical protein GCM10010287_35190 [Streptomyces variabilis]